MGQSSVDKSIEEETQKVAAQVQLQQYGEFYDGFRDNLKYIHNWLNKQPSNFLSKNRIYVNFHPEEQINTTQELINSENKIIDKVLTVFCTLCNEVNFLKNEAEAKYLDAVAYYGEGLQDNAPYEDCQLLLSKTLHLLQNISNFITHCERVVFDILNQLSAFYRLHFEITDANLYSVFDTLADLLLTLIMLEETLNNNSTLAYHWSLYKRTIQVALHKASEFSYNITEIRQLNKFVFRIENQLLSRKIFENLLNANYDKNLPVKENKRLEEEFASYLKIVYNELDRNIHKQNCTNITKLTKLILVFLLYINLFCTYDKKIVKNLAEILKKFPLVTLRCNVLLQLDTFILRHAGSLLKSSEKKWFEKDQQQYAKLCLNEVTLHMNRDVQYYTVQVLLWTLKLEARLSIELQSVKTEYLEEICLLLLDGINFCRQIKALLTTVSNLHISRNKPMNKASALSFCKLVELIKCIDSTYTRHQCAIFRLINYIVQYMEYQCLSVLNNSKKNVGTFSKRFKEIRVDAMSSLVIAEQCLVGSPTQLRLTVATLCLNLANQVKCLNDNERQKLYDMLDKLNIITCLLQKLEEVTECKFMFWNKSTLPLYLEDATKRLLDLNRIQYMLNAFENGFIKLKPLFEQNFPSHSISSFADITNTFTEQVTRPVSTKMEENLRLHALMNLQQGKRTLQQSHNELKNFLSTERVQFNDKCMDLKFQVEVYLDKTFYDLTTVVLHDWQIYGEMRTLAKHKFRLNIADDGLPNHTLEQGPDLLEITRNIHIFVSNHFYNLNNQIFIEAASNNKHLNVINIKHTANSIRTHGAGIMSTAVNYTYQFLCSKIKLFSQFLYNEQVKSRLLKEVTFFKEQNQPNFKYPYERGERFLRGISKLGIKDDGITLDQFRLQISHIGNALGYIRLIRSGGLRYFSNAINFVPNLKHIIDFESLCTEDSGFANCQPAAANLSKVVHNLCHNLTDGTNYFRLLVDVFSSIISDPKNDHLKNFYAIVPALTINFVEQMITAKEGLSKKNRTIMTFTDDGFVMGVAYLLHTLKQYCNFDSLQWFQSVHERNQVVRQDLITQLADSPKDDLKLNHTLNLSLKRLDVYEREFQNLYYNLYSAQVLFHGHNKEEETEET